MQLNGTKLKSRGLEKVYIYGDEYTRTVYVLQNEYGHDCRFFVKVYGEVIEVYRNFSSFSTTKYEAPQV